LIRPPNDVINAVKVSWGGSIQKESWKLQNVAWEFKLAGFVTTTIVRVLNNMADIQFRMPWSSSGDESILVRVRLLTMLDALNSLGWVLHSSIDMTAGPGGLGKNAG
jgi:hypothetical protein